VNRQKVKRKIRGLLLFIPAFYFALSVIVQASSNKIEAVPDYTWYKGCSPTAAANVLGFWDDHGYPLLVVGGTSATGNVTSLIEDLASAMGTTSDGSTSAWNIDEGIIAVCNSPEYGNEYNFDADNEYFTLSWNAYKSEINAGRPMIYHVSGHETYGNHSMTGVGWVELQDEDGSKFCIVHDTWSTTPEDVEVVWGWLAKYALTQIIPGNGEPVIIYVAPDGSCGGKTPCYPTVQEAINNTNTGVVIKITQGNYKEDLALNSANNLTLQGGWNSSFTARSSTSTVSSITISKTHGTVTVEYLVIASDNSPPTATITSPSGGTTFTQGREISFIGAGTDPEDGQLTGNSLIWTSDKDGQIGTGQSFTKSNLSVNTHTITLTAKDSEGATGTDSVIITIITTTFGNLPDTGQTKCYTCYREITCPQPGEDFYGQDANYTINPPSYTKLDAGGNDLPNSATSWAMVKDNVTGLVWEIKTNDSSIHDRGNDYTWQDAQDIFIGSLNGSGFGGYTDWRLPTIKELASIANLGRMNPAIDTDYFPENPIRPGVWSSTTTAHDTSFAWRCGWSHGNFGGYNKSDLGSVRAVRGQTMPSNDFVNNGDGTITDTSTGLMWQQAIASTEMTWEKALSYCEGLSLAWYTDWRLPNIKELWSIVDYQRCNPAIDTDYFSDSWSPISFFPFWSSTTSARFGTHSWYIDYTHGVFGGTGTKGGLYMWDAHVRAVRGGQ